ASLSSVWSSTQPTHLMHAPPPPSVATWMERRRQQPLPNPLSCGYRDAGSRGQVGSAPAPKVSAMISLSRPSVAEINAYLARMSRQPFSYTAVGASRDEQPPPGYVVDHRRVCLGRGEAVFT